MCMFKIWSCPVSGEDHSERLHHPRLFGGVDSAGEIRGDGAGSGGGAFPREGGAFGTRGVLCWQFVHKVHMSEYAWGHYRGGRGHF